MISFSVRPSVHPFCAYYLQNHMSNQFEIFIGCWGIPEDQCSRISGWSEIIGGCLIVISFSVRPSVRSPFRAHYLKKDSSNQFEIFIVYWDISEDLRYRISDRSEIQYGRQAAILDFLSRALSQEGFQQSIQNFYSLLGHIRGPALLNFRPVGNPIWPPGSHLGFSFARIISRRIQAIYSKFL